VKTEASAQSFTFKQLLPRESELRLYDLQDRAALLVIKS